MQFFLEISWKNVSLINEREEDKRGTFLHSKKKSLDFQMLYQGGLDVMLVASY